MTDQPFIDLNALPGVINVEVSQDEDPALFESRTFTSPFNSRLTFTEVNPDVLRVLLGEDDVPPRNVMRIEIDREVSTRPRLRGVSWSDRLRWPRRLWSWWRSGRPTRREHIVIPNAHVECKHPGPSGR